MTQQNPNQNTNQNPNPEPNINTNANPTPPAPAQQTGGVQTLSNDDTMPAGNAGNAGAAGSSAEDTQAQMFDTQQKQIAQLIEQNRSLQSQIETLLRSGASITDDSQQQQQQQQAQNAQQVGNMTQAQFEYRRSEDYVSLADLGKEIGKREYKNDNLEE